MKTLIFFLAFVPMMSFSMRSPMYIHGAGVFRRHHASHELKLHQSKSKAPITFSTAYINAASVTDLQKLKGIGKRRAQMILAYRSKHGKFKQLEDLSQVSGISHHFVEALKRKNSVVRPNS